MTPSIPSGGFLSSDDCDDDEPCPVGPDVMIPRSYQIELLEQAKMGNIIVYLETGCGKTHVAVMLLQHIADFIRNPSTKIAVFLCPTVYLAQQQAKVIRRFTDLKVGTYFGDMNVDAWKSETWERELGINEVFVMTPQILLQNLHHCFMKMDCIELLIFDECHHADKRHPYACIMQEFYHPRTKDESYKLPRILGMTASPIDGKVDIESIETELDKIERMLDAKLYTVKERSELELVVPRPFEEFQLYDASNGTHSATGEFIQALSIRKDEYIRDLLGTSRYDIELLLSGCSNVERKMLKSVDKLCNSLVYCASELGIRCAYEAVNIFLCKFERNFDREADRKSEGMEAFLHAALKILKSLLSQEIQSTPSAPADEVAEMTHLSSKVHQLISILKRYRNANDMRCIIFVERKIATRVLASLLSSIKDLSSALRFQSLAGKSTGLNVMNRKLQQQVVESFRNGEVNVLVSTSVAEEGLDIQNCHLVIRFDLPNTPCSLIQSRGRARCLQSTFIYLVERDNNEHFKLLQQFKWSEESMKDRVLSKAEILEGEKEPEIATIPTYTVESTGASISTLVSVSLLHRYCAHLAHDSFYTPKPDFSYNEGSWGVKCTIKLPTDAVLQIVEGPPTSSKADAKRMACLYACKCLYEAGALTDHLLPAADETEFPLATSIPEETHTTEKTPSPPHSTIIPDAFFGTWGQAIASVELHAYAVQFVATPNDRAYVNFGLFLEADLGPEAGDSAVELQLTNRRLVNAKCSPCGKVIFEPYQIRNAKLFQERLFSAVIDQNPGNKLPGEWNTNRLYLLLPLKENQNSLSVPIDWDCIENLISDVDYETPDGVSPDTSGGPLVKICDGYVPVHHIINSVVQTVHNGYIYCARELIPDLTAESPMVMKTKYSSYSDYYERKHSTKLQYVNQPMLKAKPYIQVHNLLTQRTTSERPAAEELKTEALVELPLELCKIRVMGLSCSLANGASLLPSFMHRLEGLLLAIQLRRTLPISNPEASPVPAHLMLEAITTSKCQESFSLEGLELLGDAFLEVAVSEHLFLVHNRMQEGKLSKLRTALICNSTLERLGKERGIMGYIRDTQFCPLDWAAPGRVADTEAAEIVDIQVHPRSKMKRTRRNGTALQGKTIADVIEALIGAYYIHGGVHATQAIMGWFGCEVGVDAGIREESRTRKHGQLGLLPESKVLELETLLKYKFWNKGLLVEALTHASYPRESGDCYQRLEFLGDAVLDFLITRHFYLSCSRDPGLLTDLRSAAVNNECFARVAVRHNLHEYLLQNSRDLSISVEKYVKFVQGSMTEAQCCHGWIGDGHPKVLSDLVESLAGAVLLDSNFDLDTVWDIFKQILRPLVTPETLRLEPIRELRELCQFEKLGDPKFEKEHGSKGDYFMTVSVHVKNEKVTEVAQKPDDRSAKKVAAIQALARLKERGFEHFSRRLLNRKALYTKTFSELVDVPEEGSQTVVSVEGPSGAFQSGRDDSVGTCISDVGDFAPVMDISPESTCSENAHKASDRNLHSGAQPATREVMFMSDLVRDQRTPAKIGFGYSGGASPGQGGGENVNIIHPRPQCSPSQEESNVTSSLKKSEMAARPLQPDSDYFRPSSSQLEAPLPTWQKKPKLDANSEFEKLSLAYRASSKNLRQNIHTDAERSRVPHTDDLNDSITQASVTAATFFGSVSHPDATCSEVATSVERSSGSVTRPFVQVGLFKHGSIATVNSSVAAGNGSSKMVHANPARTNQVLSSEHQGGGEDVNIIHPRPQCSPSQEESNVTSSLKKSEMAARPLQPEPDYFRPSSSQLEAPLPTWQKKPKLDANSEFEKLSLAYRASSKNLRQNIRTDAERSRIPHTDDLNDSITQATVTAATFFGSVSHPDATCSEVATSVERSSGSATGPFVQVGLFKHGSIATVNSSVAAGNGSSKMVHANPARTNQVLSSEHHSVVQYNVHGGTREHFMSEARINIDVQSANIQGCTQCKEVRSTLFFTAESLCQSCRSELDPPVLVSAPEPRAVPDPRWQLVKGEARSLLNELCVKQRWHDPIYKLVWRGGVSHAPLFRYMVGTTFSMGGKNYEIDVEGEPVKDAKGAKDSAAARLLGWFQEHGVVVG